MKKIMSVGLAMWLCMIALAGCGSEKTVEIDGGALADRLASELSYEDTISSTNEDMAKLLYGYDSQNVKSAKVYISAGATTEEAAVFECADAEAAQLVKEGAQQRIEAQKISVQSYKPEELSRLEAAVLRVEGNYVILSVSDDPEGAQKIIDEAIGK